MEQSNQFVTSQVKNYADLIELFCAREHDSQQYKCCWMHDDGAKPVCLSPAAFALHDWSHQALLDNS